MIKFEFNRPFLNTITEANILDELEKVAKHFNYGYFRRHDFNEIADISSSTVERHFGGSWSKGMKALKERLILKNISFNPTKRMSRNTSKRKIFEEMERIWVILGYRPSRSEWTNANPKISYDTIYRHFGGWTNACLKFIEFKTGKEIAIEDVENNNYENNKGTIKKKNNINKLNKVVRKYRTVSLNTRVKVLSRDKFRCVFCGKSPATDIGTQLHVDHIIPFSKGGLNSIENLQTLCEKCNLGKSNKEI